MFKTKYLTSILVVLLILLHVSAYSQYDKFRGSYGRRAMKFALGATIGQLTYYGDIGAEANAKAIPTKKIGYAFSMDQRFGEVTRYSSSFGIQFDFLKGKLEEYDRKYLRHLNFQTKVTQFQLLGKIHLEKLLNFNRRSRFSPIISVGFAYLKFKPMTDTLDASGNSYNWWPDNSLRNIPYSSTARDSSTIVKQDKTFESEMDPNNTFSHATITLPLVLSLEYSLTFKIRVRVNMSLYYSFNDNIDAKNNIGPENKYKDFYAYRSVSIFYGLGKGGSAYKRKRYKSKF